MVYPFALHRRDGLPHLLMAFQSSLGVSLDDLRQATDQRTRSLRRGLEVVEGDVSDLDSRLTVVEAEIVSLDGRVSTLEDAVPDYMLLGETVLGSANSEINVSSIPQTHRDLEVVFVGSHTGSGFANMGVRVNGQTTNYTTTGYYQDASVNPATSGGISQSAWVVVGILGTTGGGSQVVGHIVGASASSSGVAWSYTASGRIGASAISTRTGFGGGSRATVPGVGAVMMFAGGGNDFAAGSALRVYGKGAL